MSGLACGHDTPPHPDGAKPQTNHGRDRRDGQRVLNFVDGQITDLSEGGARIDGASMPARSRCEIHYGGEIIYAVVMWSEYDRMGVRFPYELTRGALYNALKRARHAAAIPPGQVFLNNRAAGFGRRGLS